MTSPQTTKPELSPNPSAHPLAPAAGGGAAGWEGRLFGALVLSAFVLYGVGSAFADQAVGLTLVMLNSVAVTVLGLVGFRLLRPENTRIGLGYLAARIAEAILLAGGVVVASGPTGSEADTTGYLLGMVALGLGSVPFCLALGSARWLPSFMARWGVLGYTLLAIGALTELATGRAVTVLFAIPGGLFEVALGCHLVWRGFRRH
ncbi:MAG: DUF4386 domain-containing protein [Actinomycetota bacterium]